MGSGPTTETTSKTPKELSPLLKTTGAGVQKLQRDAPLQPFLSGFTPQFVGGTTLPATNAGPTVAASILGAQPVTTGAGRKTNKKLSKLEERVNLFEGKAAEKEANNKNPKGARKKADKAQARLDDFLAGLQSTTPTTVPADTTGGAPVATTPTASADPVPLRDVFRAKGEGIATNPAITAALDAFRRNVEPGLVDRMSLAGLGRSTATADAIADQQANLVVPLIQDELSREQQAIGAEYNDFLRRQGLAEQALFTPLGGFLPSTIGSKVASSGGK